MESGGETKETLLPSCLMPFPLCPQALDLYLMVMMRIFNDRAHQLNARMVRGDGLAYVPLEAVAPVVEELLPIMEEVRGVEAGRRKWDGRVTT